MLNGLQAWHVRRVQCTESWSLFKKCCYNLLLNSSLLRMNSISPFGKEFQSPSE